MPAAQVTDPGGMVCASVEADGLCPDDQPSSTPTLTTNPLACSTVIDSTGWANGPLTEVRAIAILSEYQIQLTPAIEAGTLDDSELTAMSGLGTDMENYSGNQLATDANQFASDEQSYDSPGPSGDTEDTAYALPLEKDILALVKDCPGAQPLGQQMLNGGS